MSLSWVLEEHQSELGSLDGDRASVCTLVTLDSDNVEVAFEYAIYFELVSKCLPSPGKVAI